MIFVVIIYITKNILLYPLEGLAPMEKEKAP
jgi:hypothetical protein